MKPTLTYKLAMAAAQDHGNRHAKRHGRTKWSRADYSTAVQKLKQIYPLTHSTKLIF
jgi:hypothetical protein